jgi:hypothetical protein
MIDEKNVQQLKNFAGERVDCGKLIGEEEGN